MGQIIAFPVSSPSYPDLTADLDTAECILLIAIRSWVDAYREDDDPIPRLCQGLTIAGAPDDAAFSIDALMAEVARSGTHPIDVRCPRCPQVSDDEKGLLRAASLTQAGDGPLAEKVLRTTLLSAAGAECAIGSLTSLGELFAHVRLFLSRRRADQDGSDSRESWVPSQWRH